jgi:hypothetical protein
LCQNVLSVVFFRNAGGTPINDSYCVKHWYGYSAPTFSVNAQPKGFVDLDRSRDKFGAVAYRRGLTNEELETYGLLYIGTEFPEQYFQ